MCTCEVDEKAWIDNPKYNYVYNKLWLCRTQNLEAGPVPTKPNNYPVFYKPIINLYSLGAYSFKVEGEVEKRFHPGLFWMEYLSGEHWTINCEYKNGEISDPFVLQAEKKGDLFDLWKPYSMDYGWIEKWLGRYLSGYQGPLNLEGIGENLIEVHLRTSDQIDLMEDEEKHFCTPFFGSPGTYTVDEDTLKSIESDSSSKVVITIEEGNPELGIDENRRLGYVISGNKEEAFRVREEVLSKVVERN